MAQVDTIAGITGVRGRVVDFQVRAVSDGSDAVPAPGWRLAFGNAG